MSRASKRILVVDDEHDAALTLKVVLEEYGMLVDCFTDPITALKNFKPNVYDLIILDISMPEINGFELYKRFKSEDSRVKTIFLTALSTVEPYNIHGGEVYPKEGERHFLQKPITNRELLQQVYFITNLC